MILQYLTSLVLVKTFQKKSSEKMKKNLVKQKRLLPLHSASKKWSKLIEKQGEKIKSIKLLVV